jgi:phthiocerol/phenolphthiocerol synthesis type-I polyketide synthase E
MLAVMLSEEEIQPFLDETLSLAVINAPSLCVVSGEEEAIDGLEAELARKGVGSRHLHTSHAFHSKMMDPILGEFTAQVNQVRRHPPQIPFVSNVTGTWITSEQATDPGYWARHLRQTVRFSECVQQLLQEPNRLLLEVGPGRTLTMLAKQQPNLTKDQIVLASSRHPKEQISDEALILNTVGRLWLAGAQIDWSGFHADENRYRVPLPTYPFERQRYWVSPAKPLFTTSSMVQSSPEEEETIAITGRKEPKLKSGGKVDGPATDVQQSVAKIWQEVLGVEQAGIHDNFFELGGNSLIAIQVISRMRDAFEIELPIRTLFEAPTVAQLTSVIENIIGTNSNRLGDQAEDDDIKDKIRLLESF